MDDKDFMLEALTLARESGAEGEVPVGAVVVRNGKIVGRGRNRREINKSATAHAEIEAIEAACRTLNGWRLWECELFVTLEPCPMCTGAVINARIKRLVFGAYDEKSGSCSSVVNLFDLPYNHRPEVTGGFMREECARELRNFFSKLRDKKEPIL